MCSCAIDASGPSPTVRSIFGQCTFGFPTRAAYVRSAISEKERLCSETLQQASQDGELAASRNSRHCLALRFLFEQGAHANDGEAEFERSLQLPLIGTVGRLGLELLSQTCRWKYVKTASKPCELSDYMSIWQCLKGLSWFDPQIT